MVKPGYKQTEVGVIPEDWEVTSIEEIASIRNSRMNPMREESHFCIELENISQGTGRLIGFTDTRGAASIKNRFECGDVLFGKLRSYLRKYWHANQEGVCSTEIWVLDAIEQKCIGSYLYQLVQTDGFINASCEAYGTHMPRSDWAAVRAYKVSLPSTIVEQEAIARALSDVDALIESLERLIAKKRDIKRAAMQELLTGKKRLPGFEGEWIKRRLGDLGGFSKGSGVKKDESNSGNLPCVRYGEIYTTHHYCVREFSSWISNEVAEGATCIRQGDILFAGSGETKEEIGKCVALVGSEEAFAGGDIIILRPKNVSSVFLGYYLNTPPINRQKASLGQGDAIVHISSAALASIEISIPESAEEQNTIAEILTDMELEIATLEEKLSKVQYIKQGMMQELLTGRIRLV